MVDRTANAVAEEPREAELLDDNFTWRTIRTTYIVPFLEEVDETTNLSGSWKPSDPADERADKRVKGLLSDTVNARRLAVSGTPSHISSHFSGAPIRRALGRMGPVENSTVVRKKWTSVSEFVPAGVISWYAERLHFTIGDSTRKFLIVHVDVDPGGDVEGFLVRSKHGGTPDAPGALNEILRIIQPQITLRGDGGVFTVDAKSRDSLASRFTVSTVTMAVPTGPGIPPSIRFLEDYENWGDTTDLRWSYFLATHQAHDRRLPPDSKTFSNNGFLDKTGAYSVRVEPFGTAIIFTDSVPEAWWDQLRILGASVNPFVELAVLSYWQHTCLEYFTNEMAKQAHPAASGDHVALSASLEELRKFGDDYFFFRNCIWFDSVPNQPVWTAYLRKLQESLGDREALTRLAADYEDWTSHLGTRVALEDSKRKSLNETQIKTYSGIAAVAGIAFAFVTLLVEPASASAPYWGLGVSTPLLAAVVTVSVVFHRKKRSL